MVRRFLATPAVLAAIVLMAACAPVAPEAAPAMQEAMPAAMTTPVPGQVTVLNPMSRAVPVPGGNGAAFMTVQNGTDAPVRLVAAESDVADAVELHETVQEGDVMRMIPRPDGFEIPPGGTLELKPGGKHVMLLGVPQPLAAGESFTLTLRFEDGTAIEVSILVADVSAEMGGMAGSEMEGK